MRAAADENAKAKAAADSDATAKLDAAKARMEADAQAWLAKLQAAMNGFVSTEDELNGKPLDQSKVDATRSALDNLLGPFVSNIKAWDKEKGELDALISDVEAMYASNNGELKGGKEFKATLDGAWGDFKGSRDQHEENLKAMLAANEAALDKAAAQDRDLADNDQARRDALAKERDALMDERAKLLDLASRLKQDIDETPGNEFQLDLTNVTERPEVLRLLAELRGPFRCQSSRNVCVAVALPVARVRGPARARKVRVRPDRRRRPARGLASIQSC